ncbi:MAG: hypothetical protein GX588_05885 [Clostridiaceae bacterium]|nr:hypothetical protein [Clostridiaceae bacterium]
MQNLKNGRISGLFEEISTGLLLLLANPAILQRDQRGTSCADRVLAWYIFGL